MAKEKIIKYIDMLVTALIVLFIIVTLLFKVRYIRTGSMRPTIQIGAIVYINPHAYTGHHLPEVGDVAMYRSGSGLEVIHRIIGVTENREYIFQGDNNSTPDFKPVPLEKIEGKVCMKLNLVAPIIRMVKHLEDI